MEQGLSQDAFAAKLQVAGWDASRAAVSKIEARLRRVNDAELFIIGKVLKCELSSLFPNDLSELEDVVRHGEKGD